jgi:hypothetical protein
MELRIGDHVKFKTSELRDRELKEITKYGVITKLTFRTVGEDAGWYNVECNDGRRYYIKYGVLDFSINGEEIKDFEKYEIYSLRQFI